MSSEHIPPEGCRVELDLDAEVYHSGPELSASSLGSLLRSPGHYRYGQRNFTQAMREGTLFHIAALEPHKWGDLVVTAPSVNWQTLAGKAEAAAWAEELGAKDIPEKPKKADIIDAVEKLGCIFSDGPGVALAGQMALSARQSPWGKDFFNDEAGMREVSIFFDAETEDGRTVPFRCRPDLLIPGRAIIDIKKTQDASPEGFAKSVANFGYHRQAFMYREAVRQATGELLPFLFCAVENSEPYACAWYSMSDEFYDIGKAEAMYALGLFADCVESRSWPTYTSDLLDLVPPTWLQPQIPSDD